MSNVASHIQWGPSNSHKEIKEINVDCRNPILVATSPCIENKGLKIVGYMYEWDKHKLIHAEACTIIYLPSPIVLTARMSSIVHYTGMICSRIISEA